MIRRALRIALRVGLLLGITFAVVKTVQARRASSSGAPAEPWEPLVAPRPVDEVGEPIIEPPSPPQGAPTEATAAAPAAKKAAKATKATKAAKKAVAKAAKAKATATAGGGQVWVEPVGGVCPPSHPVKAKLSSLIYHLPGMVAYDRTRANRCYPDRQAAEADGFVRAKR